MFGTVAMPRRSHLDVKKIPRQRPAGSRHSGRRRVVNADERRRSILEAALGVFATHGFAAARLDDVAAAADVAKGTLYLYFPNKEALFEELIHSAAVPILGRLEAAAKEDLPLAVVLPRIFDLFRTDVLGTDRKLIVQLLLAEGPRFPRIAEFYYREIVSKALPILRRIARRALERGELGSDAIVRFPHLIMAPVLTAILWDGLFAGYEPLNVQKLFEAHTQLLLNKGGRKP
jgi:AcrR family transcriptional regulator